MVEHGAAAVVVVVQRPHHVLVPEQRLAEIVAIRHRTAVAHLVIGLDLVGKHRVGSGVPIGFPLVRCHVHGNRQCVSPIWQGSRREGGGSGDANVLLAVSAAEDFARAQTRNIIYEEDTSKEIMILSDTLVLQIGWAICFY
jgi:hypothetical protein